MKGILVAVSPQHYDYEEFEALCKNVNCKVIMINGKLDDAAVGIGSVARERRKAFVSKWVNIYWLEPLVNGALKTIKEKIDSGMPVFGICAGMILLSKNSKDRVVGDVEQPLLDLLDVKIERNSFGRQKDSFEAEISIEPIGISSFNGVFIRAPSVSEVGNSVEVLAKFEEKIVSVKQGNIIATAFHPELTRDTSLHKSFVQMVKDSKP